MSVVPVNGETGVSETKQQPLEWDQGSEFIVPMTGVNVCVQMSM